MLADFKHVYSVNALNASSLTLHVLLLKKRYRLIVTKKWSANRRIVYSSITALCWRMFRDT